MSTKFPGASAEEVDEKVALALIRQLEGLKGVARVEGESTAGACSLTVRFAADDPEAAQAVLNAVATAAPTLPEGVDYPSVGRVPRGPVAWFAIRTDPQTDPLADTTAATQLRDTLYRTPGISGVEIVGGAIREHTIHIDPDKLAALALTVGDVSTAVLTARLDPKPPPLRDTVVKKFQAGTVYLRDVANIDEKGTRQDAVLTRDGKPTVLLGVHRADGEKVVLPKLRPGVTVTPTDPPDVPPLLALTGPDAAKLREWAEAVRKSGAIEKAEVRPGPASPSVHLKLDREKMAKFELTMQSVMFQLDDLTDLQPRDGEYMRIVVPDEKEPRERLKRTIRTAGDRLIELGAIADAEVRDEPPTILRVGTARAVHIAGTPAASKTAADCAAVAEAQRKRMQLPPAYRVVALAAK